MSPQAEVRNQIEVSPQAEVSPHDMSHQSDYDDNLGNFCWFFSWYTFSETSLLVPNESESETFVWKQAAQRSNTPAPNRTSNLQYLPLDSVIRAQIEADFNAVQQQEILSTSTSDSHVLGDLESSQSNLSSDVAHSSHIESNQEKVATFEIQLLPKSQFPEVFHMFTLLFIFKYFSAEIAA